MKDGRTHLAYKGEHTIDLESEFVLNATVYTADQPDGDTLLVSVAEAQKHLDQADAEVVIEEVVADKGYHKNGDAGRLCRVQSADVHSRAEAGCAALDR